MPDLFNLPGMDVMEIKEEDRDYLVSIRRRRALDGCPFCGSAQLVANGTKRQRIRDIPVNGKRVLIAWDRQRFTCRQCGRTSYDQHPEFDPDRRMTRRLVNHIGRSALSHSFAQVADMIGADEKTVRLVWADWSERELSRLNRVAPRWLGIAGIHLLGKARGIFTDVDGCAALDLLPDRSEATVVAWLESLSAKEMVEVVTLDMWRPYYDAVRAVLPGAMVVVDRRHMQRLINLALEDVREAISLELSPSQRRRLNRERILLQVRRRDLRADQAHIIADWEQRFPVLNEAYNKKEDFAAIWDQPTEDAALKKYEVWRDGLPEFLNQAFAPINRTIQEWQSAIFASFRVPERTAYFHAKALHDLRIVLSRMTRTQSFTVLRAKLLLAQREKEQSNIDSVIANFDDSLSPLDISGGIDLSTLAHLIADDEGD
jgi:transposase